MCYHQFVPLQVSMIAPKKKFLAPLKIVHNPIAFKFETTSHLHNIYTKPLLFSRKNGVPLYANCLQEIFWLRF